MSEIRRILRFLGVGVAAASVHFTVLAALVDLAGLRPTAIAGMVAAIAGVTASFVGNRLFVFRTTNKDWRGQAGRFVALYAATSLVHGATLYLCTDLGGGDYRVAFVLATALQAGLSYIGNRTLVFGRPD